MPRLSHHHYEKMLAHLRLLYAETSLRALRHRMVTDLGQLVPGSYISYNAVLRGPAARVVARYAYPDPPLAQSLLPVFNLHCSDHPFVGHPDHRENPGARKFSDFLSQCQLRSTALYTEYYRKLGTRFQIYFQFDSGGAGGLGLCINRDKIDFDETDRAILNLLIPHYRQAHENVTALERSRADLGLMEETHTTLGEGILIATREGRIEWASANATRLLGIFFLAPTAVAGQWLPEPARRWSAAALPGVAKTIAPLHLVGSRGLLVLRIVARQDDRVTVLIRTTAPPGTSARVPALSSRENEVLAWIAQAKSDAEIATILGLSNRTVGKHVENILAKLQVENRAAAMRIYLDHERP